MILAFAVFPYAACEKQGKNAAEQAFPVICSTLASAAADIELQAIEEFGELGGAIFDRIAAGPEGGVSGLFGADALSSYSKQTGTNVETPPVQNLADKLVTANLVARPAHGTYKVADPFVRKVWLDRRNIGLTPVPT
ncbi:hypothetical protein os1_08640 [Comamonadaceae bacterium OS-1]|nr:hypothetical protein os1_08640 [Comamonadaceae bacterium OS-1]